MDIFEKYNWFGRFFLGYLLLFSIACNGASYGNYISSVKQNIDTLLVRAQKESKKNVPLSLDLYKQALEIALSNKNNPKTSIIYKRIGYLYYKTNDLKNAIVNYNKCISLDSISTNAADSYFNICLIKRKLDDENSMLNYLGKSLALYITFEDSKNKFNTYLKAGIIYKNAGKYYSALEYLLPAYTGFEELNNYSKMATTSSLIGNVQRVLRNYKVAKIYYQKSLEHRITSRDSGAIADSFNSLGNLYKDLKQVDSAIYFYEKAIYIKQKIHNTREIGRIFSNLASMYNKKRKHDDALKTYTLALGIKKKGRDTLALANTYNELAYTLIEKNNFELSKKYLDSASQYSKDIDNKDFTLRNLETLTYYYQKIGNNAKALEFLIDYQKMYAHIFDVKQTEIIQELQERFETEKKQKEILQLNLTNNEKELIIVEQKSNIQASNRLLIFAIFVIIGLSSIYFLYRKVQTKNHEIDKIQAVYTNQELLKDKISKDLHDIVISNYEGIKLKLQSLFEKEKLAIENTNIINQISEINQQVRKISHRLSPLGGKIKNATLCQIIESQLIDFQIQNNIEVKIDLPLPEELDQFSIESKTNFYAIFLELLHNTSKHSYAKQLIIIHKKNETSDSLFFRFSDNGIGFDKKGQKGLGINNIEQRSKLLDGFVKFNTSDSGTIVLLEIPIKLNLDEIKS